MSGDDAVVFLGFLGILCLVLLGIEYLVNRGVARDVARLHRLRREILQRDRRGARRGEPDGLDRYFGTDRDDT